MTDYINVCRTAVAESYDDGYEKGCEKGLEQGRIEMALDMLACNEPIEKTSNTRIFLKKRCLN